MTPTPPSDSLVRLSNCGVRFGSVEALRGVHLEVRRGEVIAVVGANGSGKSTLLHALNGRVEHTGGRHLAQPLLSQVLVDQRPFLLRLSAWRNVRVALWLARVPWHAHAERASRALSMAGLLALKDRPARSLSGGQQQRLALARAWAIQPDLLLLDEPTANLDPSAKREVETLLSQFAAAGATLVLSTHNLGQAKRLATRVVYLDQGVVRADQPTAQFFEAHGDGRTDLFLKGELTWDLT